MCLRDDLQNLKIKWSSSQHIYYNGFKFKAKWSVLTDEMVGNSENYIVMRIDTRQLLDD